MQIMTTMIQAAASARVTGATAGRIHRPRVTDIRITGTAIVPIVRTIAVPAITAAIMQGIMHGIIIRLITVMLPGITDSTIKVMLCSITGPTTMAAMQRPIMAVTACSIQPDTMAEGMLPNPM
jgi:hypothetical protein